MMKIKVSDYQLDEKALYRAQLVDIEAKDGDYGAYFRFLFSTPFGQTSLIVNARSTGKMRALLGALGIDIDQLAPETELDLTELIGREILVRLQYDSEGYLRIAQMTRLESTSSETEDFSDLDQLKRDPFA